MAVQALLLLAAAVCSAGEVAGNSPPDLEASVFGELEDLVAPPNTSSFRLLAADLRRDLYATWKTLPKSPAGKVRLGSARYALHRLFVQRHGWQMAGLKPTGETWSSGTPLAALVGRAKPEILEFFESRLPRGFDFAELSALATTLEHMVHSEVLVRLRTVFNSLDLAEAAVLSPKEASKVLRTYMASYVLGADASRLTREAVLQAARNVETHYPTWRETLSFLQQVSSVVAQGAQSYDFALVARILQEVSSRYGRWQSKDCKSIKSALVSLQEVNGTGRIRLADFYRSSLKGGKWQFSESVEYLRHLGVLDDSDPEDLQVMIPNYINSPSNCVASSGYYSVCCVDDCEEVVDYLEERIQEPRASPERIIEEASRLDTSLNLARQGEDDIAALLRSAAAYHGGEVPMHGRLFKQWLHHAFPTKCPYPHMSGTTRPVHPSQFEAVGTVEASNLEMRQFMQTRRQPGKPRVAERRPHWSLEEELVDPEENFVGQRPRSSRRAWAQGLVLVAAAGSSALFLARAGQPAWEALLPSSRAAKIYAV